MDRVLPPLVRPKFSHQNAPFFPNFPKKHLSSLHVSSSYSLILSINKIFSPFSHKCSTFCSVSHSLFHFLRPPLIRLVQVGTHSPAPEMKAAVVTVYGGDELMNGCGFAAKFVSCLASTELEIAVKLN